MALAKLLSKNRPDAGTLDIPIQQTIFGRGLSVRVFEIASRQHGPPARMSFFGQRPAFFGQPLYPSDFERKHGPYHQWGPYPLKNFCDENCCCLAHDREARQPILLYCGKMTA